MSGSVSKAIHHDLLISGGGSNGMALAMAIARQSGGKLSIGIIENSKDTTPDQDIDRLNIRTVALAKHSCDVLERFGLGCVQQMGTAIKHIYISDQGHLGSTSLHHHDYNIDSLGCVVPLARLNRALADKLASDHAGSVHWYRPDGIQSLQQTQHNVEITLQSGAQISAALLVVAEGGHSPTRQLLRMPAQQHDYQQVAIVANIATAKHHQNRAFERFTPNGPLALLPIESGAIGSGSTHSLSSLVWTLDKDQYQEMMQASDSAFLAALQAAFGYRLGKLLAVGQRIGFPLQLISAEQLIDHRVVLLGNAAQSLHPIAGQGLNLGLRDVDQLSQIISQACKNGQNIGLFQVLHAYQQQRQPDRQRVIRLTHGLVSIFSNSYFPLVAGRNIGLSALNLLPAIKQKLAYQSMGLNTL